ncbi:MAG: cell division topological specificity factor MinE [Chloroflexi bacterium]|nr:cell division topological specificity factor MinE [Chloroflexota bacterium]
MASFLERLIGRRDPSSAELARERLKLVLVTDRSDLSPDKLERMQGEIIQVIRKYLEIDETEVAIKLEQRDRKTYLVADVPLEQDRIYKPPPKTDEDEAKP